MSHSCHWQPDSLQLVLRTWLIVRASIQVQFCGDLLFASTPLFPRFPDSLSPENQTVAWLIFLSAIQLLQLLRRQHSDRLSSGTILRQERTWIIRGDWNQTDVTDVLTWPMKRVSKTSPARLWQSCCQPLCISRSGQRTHK